MKKYSIKDIEKLTGIKKHTLRVWEQRYAFLEPRRSETNSRFYDEEQLRQLLNVSLLLGNGYRISELSRLSHSELNREVKNAWMVIKEHPDQAIEFLIKDLIECMLELNEAKFEKLFTTSLIKRGLEGTITDVVYPFIERMGILWRTGDISTAQEHFMYFLIRQKVIVSIDSLKIASKEAPTYLVFLPESDFDDLLILLCIYLIKSKGNRIINLGLDVNVEDILPIAEQIKPRALMTFFAPESNIENLQGYVNGLKSNFPDCEILVSGREDILSDISFPSKIISISSLDDLNDYLSA